MRSGVFTSNIGNTREAAGFYSGLFFLLQKYIFDKIANFMTMSFRFMPFMVQLLDGNIKNW
jgi:hypothetical protein